MTEKTSKDPNGGGQVGADLSDGWVIDTSDMKMRHYNDWNDLTRAGSNRDIIKFIANPDLPPVIKKWPLPYDPANAGDYEEMSVKEFGAVFAKYNTAIDGLFRRAVEENQ